MLNAKAFANAVTVVTAVFYILCALVSYAMPDLVFTIANSWIHSLNLNSIRSTEILPLGTLVLGLVTISVLTWITTYVTIVLYNRWK
ncbi:DUF5676 family membrane protein [Patescibacteria group bacterium]|nr:DUF5676 family membrane protein [Patescibacteria group bacterium]